jgi:hypothetical protein
MVPRLFSRGSRLQRLIFPGEFSRCADTIKWGGLTSLTELHLQYNILEQSCGDDVSDSELPPNLVRLTGAGWGRGQPLELLTPLTKLQHLDGTFSAKEVAALATAIPGLGPLRLRIDARSEADVSKAVTQLSDAGVTHAVAGVRLQLLRHKSSRTTDPARFGPALQPLTALSRLTALAVEGYKVGADCTAALSTLRGLAAVSLRMGMPGAASVPAGYAPLSLACELPEGV